MTINFKIDNCDALPDGGPLLFTSNKSGFDLGRESHLDWTLPDDSRYISGRHCEIRYDNGKYWLYDISRNGTFLNGSKDRVKSPYHLQNGDRLTIGHYIVAVTVLDDFGQSYAEEEHGSHQKNIASESEDIWSVDGDVPPPIDRRDLMPAKKQGQRAADFSQQYLDLPPLRTDEHFQAAHPQTPQPAAAMPQPNPFSPESDASVPFVPGQPASGPPVPLPDAAASPVSPSVPGALSPGQLQAPVGGNLLQQIAAGAGVPETTFSQGDPAAMAQEIGAVLRVVVEQMAQLLKARAAAKTMAKSSKRTMISAMNNNPLKFTPTTEEMFAIMFAGKSGYMGARESLEDGFHDLKAHEFATYSAMQKGLARLLEEFAPSSIEDKLSSSAFSSKSGKAWDTYVSRWEAMTEAHENGILDVFLSHFAEAYDEATKKQ